MTEGVTGIAVDDTRNGSAHGRRFRHACWRCGAPYTSRTPHELEGRLAAVVSRYCSNACRQAAYRARRAAR